MGVSYRRLVPALGVEVRGVDANDLGDNLFAELRARWNDAGGVMVLRDQQLTPEAHIAFSRRFGRLNRLEGHTVTKYLLPGHPEIYRVSNRVVDGVAQGRKGAGTYWHSDVSFEPEPAMASLLHAVEIPPNGGDTIFANLYLAYEALSAPMQRFLGTLHAVHDFFAARGTGYRNEVITQAERDAYPPVSHPVVRVHPETGRRSLFLNRGFTSHIEGLEPGESRALLEYLFTLSERPDFQYRHVYEPNDLVIWDNRCTMHYAVMDYDGVAYRMMHRTTVIGDRPVGPEDAVGGQQAGPS